MKKPRLDIVLVERGLAASRSLAQRLIMAGQVQVEGQVVYQPSETVDPQARVELLSGPRYVSRGGEKLEAALQAFPIPVGGRICADVGASTGGFTDCLLQAGAARVYAIDVGRGILDWRLRQDPRVVVMEAVNARFIERLPEPVSLVTVDASFISLSALLPGIADWFGGQPGDLAALIKPQFEAGRAEVSRGKGVVRSPEVHRRVLVEVLGAAQAAGYGLHGLIRSPLLGPKGNVEFLAWLRLPPGEAVPLELLLAGVGL
jgi:23S rRNA (cytidine1920-2'-O)/16S rRNA (cytidine1409-2'-O)-methyltransferase